MKLCGNKHERLLVHTLWNEDDQVYISKTQTESKISESSEKTTRQTICYYEGIQSQHDISKYSTSNVT